LRIRKSVKPHNPYPLNSPFYAEYASFLWKGTIGANND
jgi:hypothetical protein